MQEGTEKQAVTRAVPRIDLLEHTYIPHGTLFGIQMLICTCRCILSLTINSYHSALSPQFVSIYILLLSTGLSSIYNYLAAVELKIALEIPFT